MQQPDAHTHDGEHTEQSGDAGPDAAARAQQDAAPSDAKRRESGQPGGGQGRVEVPGETRVHPLSAGIDPNRHDEIRTQAEWGQGARGAEGYEDAGGSELTMRDGQVLGGLTSGPSGEPTIDIHGKDRPPEKAGETRDR